jgi:hypothetical protein
MPLLAAFLRSGTPWDGRFADVGSENRSTTLLAHMLRTHTVIEITLRLVLALVLSLAMALLLAWGWDHSDRVSLQVASDASVPDIALANAPERP